MQSALFSSNLFRNQLGKGSKKKVMEFFITSERTPPLKLWNTFLYLFYIWVLKSVLIKDFFSLFSGQKFSSTKFKIYGGFQLKREMCQIEGVTKG